MRARGTHVVVTLIAAAAGVARCQQSPVEAPLDAKVEPESDLGEPEPRPDASPDASTDAPSDVTSEATSDASRDAPASTAPRLLTAAPSFYPRVIRRSNGKLLASVVTAGAGTSLGGAIFESDDEGVTFTLVGRIDEPTAARGLCCATLYELPRALGVLPAGALLWSASVGGEAPSAPMTVVAWSSVDGGRRWTRLPDVATATVPQRQGGLWEPELSMLDDGSLVCHYSDETDPAHSQKLVAVRTRDGLRWGDFQATVELTDPALRPGMATVRRGPGGRYFMAYEICGPLPYDCTAFLRSSADGWSWGPARSEGTRVATHDGLHVRGAPTLAWSPSPGASGRMYLVAQMALRGDGSVSPHNGSVVLANSEAGEGAWYPIAAAIPVTVPARHFCPNYSSSLLPLEGGAVHVEVASRWDGVACHTFFARGPLTGTDDDAGLVAGAVVRLVNARSGHCLDVAAGSATPGAAVQQWTCNGLAPQQWLLRRQSDGAWTLQAQHSGQCLAVADGSATPGAAVVQRPCDASAAQRWTFRNRGLGYYTLEHAGSGTCLDVPTGATTPGARMQVWTCNELSPQRWEVRARD